MMAGQFALGQAIRPRPRRGTLEDLKTNAPSEIRPVAYVAGTAQVTPSRIWYGDFSQRAVERDSQWTDYVFLGFLAGLLDFITVAYRYYCGECFAICFGPDAHIEQIFVGERIMFQAVPGTENAGAGFLIDDPQAWGGDQPPGEGGMYSWVDITRGNYTDPTNAYLESLLSTPPNKTPSLRGVTALVVRGRSGFTESGYFAAGGVGYIPRFREWRVTVRRQPNHLATAFSKVGIHANPMEVIYEHATSFEYGARVPEEELNLASFRSVAQTLHGEGLGWSGKIENPTSPREVVKNVLAQIDGVLDPSPSLGLTARLIRRDYTFGSLRVLDRDVITEVRQYSPGTYEDSVNKIIVPFDDPDNNFQPRPGIYIDPANQLIQNGRIVPQTQDYIGVGDYATANLLATRDGRALSMPRDVMECSVKPSFGRLAYLGEVLSFQCQSPALVRLMRVQAITPGTVDDPSYQLNLIEDQFATGSRAFGEPDGTFHDDPAIGLDTAPPSATWNTVDFPPDGLIETLTLHFTEYEQTIKGGIVFGSYAPGGQYARIYVTEPGGVQTLSPLRLAPDASLEATFNWPALAVGTYQFCVETYSLHNVTNGVKVCASIAVVDIGSPSVSPSASVSPSVSPSSSASPSISPSSSASPSQSPSISPSTSPSVSPSASVSPSVSPSASDSPSAAAPQRFYLPSTGAAEVSPAFGSGWDVTANADRIKCVTTRINSAPAQKTLTTNATTSPQFDLNRQYVSAPLEAGTISGTVKGQVKCRRASAVATLAVQIFVVSNDGSTVVGTLLSVTASQTAATPPLFPGASTTTNRRMLDASDVAAIPIATQAISAGDRLVIEIGCRESSNAQIVGMTFNDDNATDLPEDDTTTNDFNPWIEFSDCPPEQ